MRNKDERQARAHSSEKEEIDFDKPEIWERVRLANQLPIYENPYIECLTKQRDLCGAILLAALEHPLLRRYAMETICDMGNIVLHLHAISIPVNPKLFRWSKEAARIKIQCEARNRMEIYDPEEC